MPRAARFPHPPFNPRVPIYRIRLTDGLLGMITLISDSGRCHGAGIGRCPLDHCSVHARDWPARRSRPAFGYHQAAEPEHRASRTHHGHQPIDCGHPGGQLRQRPAAGGRSGGGGAGVPQAGRAAAANAGAAGVASPRSLAGRGVDGDRALPTAPTCAALEARVSLWPGASPDIPLSCTFGACQISSSHTVLITDRDDRVDRTPARVVAHGRRPGAERPGAGVSWIDVPPEHHHGHMTRSRHP